MLDFNFFLSNSNFFPFLNKFYKTRGKSRTKKREEKINTKKRKKKREEREREKKGKKQKIFCWFIFLEEIRERVRERVQIRKFEIKLK